MAESTVTFRHEYNESFKLKGVKHTVKHNIIDGSKGLSFMFLKKVGDDVNDFYKVYAKEENGKYKVEEIKGDKKSESELSEADVKKMLKANAELAFVLNYMEKERGKYKGKVLKGGGFDGDMLPVADESVQMGGAKRKGSKKSSKKGSKKSSKKGSKKMTGGGKKKGSKKSSKKGSKKGSKKSSKKGSKKMTGGAKRKGSKKSSKKGSKKSSKKGSKKMSGGAKRKGSKKSSKKASRKGSKKGSKKSRKY